MKKNHIFFLFLLTVLFSSCIKNDPVLFTGSKAEIDQTVWNANAAGLTYPILTLIPAQNRPVNTTRTSAAGDSTLRRFSGTIRVRINQVGPVSTKDETVGYKIFGSPITSVSFPQTVLFTSAAGTAGRQEPAANSGTLAVSDAIAGTHFAALSGKVTIPAKSSFGFIDIQILNAGATAGQARFIGIELDETGSIKPSVNYNKLGLVIDQR